MREREECKKQEDSICRFCVRQAYRMSREQQARRSERYECLCPRCWEQCIQATPAWKGWLTGETAPAEHLLTHSNKSQFGNRWPSSLSTCYSPFPMPSTLCCMQKKQNHCKKWLLERKAQATLVLCKNGREDGTRREGREKVLCSLCPVPSLSSRVSTRTICHLHPFTLSSVSWTPIRLEHCQSLLSFSLATILIVNCRVDRKCVYWRKITWILTSCFTVFQTSSVCSS